VNHHFLLWLTQPNCHQQRIDSQSLVICGFIDQPITCRENRSSTTAKYNQPS